ncbi:hypothetical protein HNQ70_003292 [Quisquiliibacterium transsilvanicum]|uniref:Uncharacterized protein n=1 Tax=Quisquiliibacterium transsilvanicum TaxID=1549638 RepID=A0A7W8HJK9_9BURK|nr:hypothetical protein [Quisquiliibacterium transsilvanicum]MBB5273264.1 hypothetical protein [Quisquiliibacterium transsilvanicum]
MPRDPRLAAATAPRPISISAVLPGSGTETSPWVSLATMRKLSSAA